MSVTLRQLEYFVAVVDTGSFTRAAASLHVSQPGLSNQVRTLEETLGGLLLERLPREIRLTPAGRTVLPHARAGLAHAERAATADRRAAGIDAGELHVGTLYSLSVGVLPGGLAAWRSTYPDVAVRLVEFRRGDALATAMEAGRADVAVGPVPQGWTGPRTEIGTESFVLVAAAGLLPDADEVELSSLAAADWVHYTPPSGRPMCSTLPAAAPGSSRVPPCAPSSRVRQSRSRGRGSGSRSCPTTSCRPASTARSSGRDGDRANAVRVHALAPGPDHGRVHRGLHGTDQGRAGAALASRLGRRHGNVKRSSRG